MSRLSASWPTFVRPSLRTYERGETRDDFDVHAAASDLTLKISSFSKDTESTHFTAEQKPKGDSRHIRSFFCFLLFFFSEKVDCANFANAVRYLLWWRCLFGYNAAEGTTELLMGVLARCVHAAPSAPVMILCSTRVCSGACDKHACDS
jgi:hypothetical protein